MKRRSSQKTELPKKRLRRDEHIADTDENKLERDSAERAKGKTFQKQDSGYESEISGSSQNEDEDDAIATSDCQQRTVHGTIYDRFDYERSQEDARKGSTSRLVDTILKRTTKQVSVLYIQHPKQDSPSGDEFGARLKTKTTVYKDSFRHTFVNVLPNSPANAMKIKDKDELVMIDNKLVIQLNHQQVLNLFKQLQVDGHTRLDLVIRRKRGFWIETSAVLLPHKRTVTDRRFIKNKSDLEEKEFYVRYEICGDQKYMAIDKSGVHAINCTGNDLTVIKKKVVIVDKGPGDFEVQVYLADPNNSWYLLIGEDGTIQSSRSEVYLSQDKVGAECMFFSKDFQLHYDKRGECFDTVKMTGCVAGSEAVDGAAREVSPYWYRNDVTKFIEHLVSEGQDTVDGQRMCIDD